MMMVLTMKILSEICFGNRPGSACGGIKPAIAGLLRLVVAVPVLALLAWSPAAAGDEPAGRGKVLVVMSYHQDYEGETEIARGLEAGLPDVEFRYFYLNAKYDYPAGARMGAEAYRVFRDYQPDAVVAVDDPAQVFFVVPYLRERVSTPVIFCGVNFEADKYRYPAANVTGVLEKKHYRESLGFARVLVPALEKVALIYKDNPTNRQNLAQIEAEEGDYPLAITGKYPVTSLNELLELVSRLEKRVDGLMLLNLSGIVDAGGSALDGAEVLSLLAGSCRLPTIGADAWEIRAGLLCGVVKSNSEQGTISAALLRKIRAGAAPSELPLLRNCNGKRLLNATTLKRLGLPLSPEAVMGTELLTTGQRD
jgi:ABC-type uncharacterized transport system substrate-binding protein